MDTNLFTGKLVRLSVEEPEVVAKAFTQWEQDSEYVRLLDNDPARLWSEKKTREWIDKDLEKQIEKDYLFFVRTIVDNRLIGFVCLWGQDWCQGDSWVGIGIGERDCWGKGYGTEAMQLLLRYAFQELNLRRVSLFVFGYNPRAIHSYEKCGYVLEGRVRGALLRDGQRWDYLTMGVLREEWQKMQEEQPV